MIVQDFYSQISERGRKKEKFQSFYVCIRFYVFLILVHSSDILPTVQSITFQFSSISYVFQLCLLHEHRFVVRKQNFLNLNAIFSG